MELPAFITIGTFALPAIYQSRFSWSSYQSVYSPILCPGNDRLTSKNSTFDSIPESESKNKRLVVGALSHPRLGP